MGKGSAADDVQIFAVLCQRIEQIGLEILHDEIPPVETVGIQRPTTFRYSPYWARAFSISVLKFFIIYTSIIEPAGMPVGNVLSIYINRGRHAAARLRMGVL